MVEEEKPKNFSERGIPEKPEEKKEEKPVAPEDTSIFRGRPYLTHSQLKEELEKASPYVPGSSALIPREEREKMVEELFGKEGGNHGYYIDRNEFKKAVKNLEEKKSKATSSSEKLEIDRKIRYLKKLGGL